MAKYVDGFVLVVPKDRSEEYEKMAKEGRDLWMRSGALEFYECRGDDLETQKMGDVKARTYPELTGANNDEEVWFSFIIFKSKEHRDEVNAKVMEGMKDYEEKYGQMQMPFDISRMAYGGFEVKVEGE